MRETGFDREPENAEGEMARRKIEDRFEHAGLIEKLDDRVMDRLVLLELRSTFNEDSRMIECGVNNVLHEIAKGKDNYKLTPERIAESRIAALIHDVGKSGPADASQEEQEAVVALFAAEGLKNREQSVGDAVKEVFSGKDVEMSKHLTACGVDLSMPMLQFWESHAKWGFDIIDQQCPQLSVLTKQIAASHHIDKGEEFNFYHLALAEIPDEARLIGQLEYYLDILQERALVAMDKYDAQMNRSGADHEQALAWVEKNIKAKYGNDIFMKLVLQNMRRMGKDRIFAPV